MPSATNTSRVLGEDRQFALHHQWRPRADRWVLAIAVSASVASPLAASTLQPLPNDVSALSQSEDRARAEQCLATAIAYEAGHESTEGKQAVAEVILNRARSRAYPKTVCGVVFAGSTRRTGCQFTFTCDGSLKRRLPSKVMTAAFEVAVAALDGRNPSRAPGATHYHADYVYPYWAPSLRRVTKLGAHIFYRARAELPASSRADYVARGEPVISAFLDASPAQALAAAPATTPPVSNGPFAPWGLSVQVAIVQP